MWRSVRWLWWWWWWYWKAPLFEWTPPEKDSWKRLCLVVAVVVVMGPHALSSASSSKVVSCTPLPCNEKNGHTHNNTGRVLLELGTLMCCMLYEGLCGKFLKPGWTFFHPDELVSLPGTIPLMRAGQVLWRLLYYHPCQSLSSNNFG